MNQVNSDTNRNNEPECKSLLDSAKQTVPPSLKETVSEIDEAPKDLPLTDETSCGIWFIRGPNLQKFANDKAYVILYGVLGCVFAASFAYFNATITTIEKRFKIPTKMTSFVVIGTDLTEMFGPIYCYYAGRGHQPRWMAFGIYLVVLFCCLTMLPHFLYGPGEDALHLTKEYESSPSDQMNLSLSLRSLEENPQLLCSPEANRTGDCLESDGNLTPPLILFVGHLVRGLGNSFFTVLGTAYMDDNVKKSKVPALISFSYFLRLLGPAIGYSLATYTLKLYIDPRLTPVITNENPRWLGAWWIGWIIFAVLLFIVGNIVGLFPKTLPRAAARRHLALEKEKTKSFKAVQLNVADNVKEGRLEAPTSISDMLRTFKRLLTNKTLMCNNASTVFYFLAFEPFEVFMPKYVETQYKQSASAASFITGAIGIIFSAIGILLAGLVITKFKPRARYLATWNVIVGAISVLGIISYVFLGCHEGDSQVVISDVATTSLSCSESCNCDYVEYNPVCSEDGRTFISACHAGCQTFMVQPDGTEMYSNCSCIKSTNSEDPFSKFGTAITGPCPVDCKYKFYLYLLVTCLLRFFGAAGRASNFLVAIRCVDEIDKSISLAISVAMFNIFAFIPSSIITGYLFDAACILWGKTCEGTGNCWLYDDVAMRYLISLTAAGFTCVGTIFDVGVWYLVKDLKIFDDEYHLSTIVS